MNHHKKQSLPVSNRQIKFGKQENASPQRSSLIGLVVSVVLLTGCRGPQTTVALPARHSVLSDQLLVLSDFKLPKEHELIEDLKQLRDDVTETLNIPSTQQQQVVVYLFSDEETYKKYLAAAFPGLPDRRAYFVGSEHDLAVYTHWGERIREDLRHEYTHGLLHASMKNVPLWLDEGLAEYFEVVESEPGRVNTDYARRLTQSQLKGWQPRIERLEQIEKFSDMRLEDYQEAWAWVHFMLHSSPETRDVLLSYLQELRANRSPALISGRLRRQIPDLEAQFDIYLTSLNSVRTRVGSL